MSVLLAYDGKPTSQKALDYAIEYSLRFEEPLYVITVVREDQMDPDDPDQSVQEYMQAAQREAASQGATVHTIVKTGKPGEVIIEVADLYECECIVLGRSNRSSLDRLLMGSVSEYITKNASGIIVMVSESD